MWDINYLFYKAQKVFIPRKKELPQTNKLILYSYDKNFNLFKVSYKMQVLVNNGFLKRFK